MKEWLGALHAARSDREELGRLQKELDRMQEKVRHLSTRLAEFEETVGSSAPRSKPGRERVEGPATDRHPSKRSGRN
ncbi:MAG: hypothetical protein ACYDFT_03705 [Thermoplasmata archaeon]